jgi:hypothetical protein
METDGEIFVEGAASTEDPIVRLAPEGEGRERAILHFRMIRGFVEGYRVAARACETLLKGPASPKDLAKRAMTVGERMFLAGEIAYREAITRPVIENAFLAFADQGYLSRNDGAYVLPESYASEDAVRVIEGRLTSYLPAQS